MCVRWTLGALVDGSSQAVRGVLDVDLGEARAVVLQYVVTIVCIVLSLVWYRLA